jgi:hypothetical protein
MEEIKPTYTTLKQSKVLKEKGFDEQCKNFYYDFGQLAESIEIFKNSNLSYENFSAPEQHVVVEWLRVNHGIWICANKSMDAEDNGWFHFYVDNKWSAKLYDTPQEAYSAAFDYIKDNDLI